MHANWPAERLGLNVRNEWWAAPALLKSFEAAGFARVQVHAPPRSVLSDPRQCAPHATALAAALATTGLAPVVHAPPGLRMGARDADRAAEGLLSYAAEVGATHAVYHACALPDAPESEDALLFEARSLAALSLRAERLGVTIAVENLAPVFPGPELLSASPMVLRGLVNRIGSERIGICLDLGHAHIVAELRRTSLEALIEPVLDTVTLFHAHDNLGARWQPVGAESGVDPLRLDLHLPPGRGTLPWARLAPGLAGHEAPLMLEVHLPYRPRAEELYRSAEELLSSADGVSAFWHPAIGTPAA
jgi:sugar phosphate isomerase/epimerase